MAAQYIPARRQSLIVEVEASPAYEFVISLCVWSEFQGDMAYDVGKAWFDDVRAKASPDLLATIEQFSFHSHLIWEHIFNLAYSCPLPRDVSTFIDYVAATDPLELRLHFL